MRVFRDPDEGRFEQDLASFAIGTLGGLAAGVLISRLMPRAPDFRDELRTRARSIVRRLRPARLHRLAIDQEELDHLEDTVLHAFLHDEILSERGVDIGAISHGIIEVSGSVWSEEEAERAVALANRTPGVRTVVNRIEVDDVARRAPLRRPLDEDQLEGTFTRYEGRTGGMGRRRQGSGTEPDRMDDSQRQRENALAAADRDQWSDEGFTRTTPPRDERPDVQDAGGSRYSEDELDNQDPHGKHAERTLDEPPQALNTQARVGEGMKPGTELRIERSELSIDETPPRDREG
ncbi:MAG TPA: BON domain-containing protein [Longimicrobiaceae bacterium]|nr:BON domain-containing protein [Longimicrobiaceae bacterium]